MGVHVEDRNVRQGFFQFARQRMGVHSCTFKRASPWAGVGQPAWPPGRVAFSPAAADAKRTLSSSSPRLANAQAYAPWNTSPHPVVSMTSTKNAGRWRGL